MQNQVDTSAEDKPTESWHHSPRLSSFWQWHLQWDIYHISYHTCVPNEYRESTSTAFLCRSWVKVGYTFFYIETAVGWGWLQWAPIAQPAAGVDRPLDPLVTAADGCIVVVPLLHRPCHLFSRLCQRTMENPSFHHDWTSTFPRASYNLSPMMNETSFETKQHPAMIIGKLHTSVCVGRKPFSNSSSADSRVHAINESYFIFRPTNMSTTCRYLE